MPDLADPVTQPTDLPFDLAESASRNPQQYRTLVEGLAFLMGEVGGVVDSSCTVGALLDAMTVTDRECDACEAVAAAPVVALWDGALFRVDAACMKCGHVRPTWFEAPPA